MSCVGENHRKNGLLWTDSGFAHKAYSAAIRKYLRMVHLSESSSIWSGLKTGFRSYAKIMPCRNWVEDDEINVSKTSHILPCYPYRMFNCLLHSSLTRKYKHENFKLHSSNLFNFFCFHCSYFQKQLFRRATRNFSGQGRFCEIRALQ